MQYGENMPKSYTIKPPKKCNDCDKASSCEFLKNLYQKPFDATGVILNAKAFYLVFCKLEKRCSIPFGDREKMQQYHKEAETGKRPYLDPALVTNGILAAELALKALTLKETGTYDCTHRLDMLFYALPNIHKDTLTEKIKTQAHQNDDTLKFYLEAMSDFFISWRYSFEREDNGYSGFLNDFIHIVCDYAIADIESLSESDN